MTKINVMLSSMIFAENTTPTERVDLFDEYAEMIEYGADFDAVFDFSDPAKIKIKNCTYSRARYMIGKWLDMKPSELKRIKDAEPLTTYQKACAEGRTCFSCAYWESGYGSAPAKCNKQNVPIKEIVICKDYETYTPRWIDYDEDERWNYAGI